MTTDPAALSPANETPKACTCVPFYSASEEKHVLGRRADCPKHAPVQPPAPDPNETCPSCGGKWDDRNRPGVCGWCLGDFPLVRPAPVSPATTGGTNETEDQHAYERAVLRQILSNAPSAREDGGDITPDWISVVTTAMLDHRPLLAGDARTRADAWDAAIREVREACLTPQEFAIADRAKRLNPYRADEQFPETQ